MEAYIGQINLWAPLYAPVGWSFCNGTVLSIGQYTALFTILSNRYGGDGHTTFALPNLNGKFIVGTGTAATGTIYDLAETGGTNTATLNSSNMPAHSHTATVSSTTSATLNAATSNGVNTSLQANQGLATPTTVGSPSTTTLKIYGPLPGSGMVPLAGASGTVTSASLQVGSSPGASSPYNTLQPYMAINHIICLEGNYPPPPQ